MCGFVGIFRTAPSASALDRSVVERMRDRMSHRGPDADGYFQNPERTLALGHRRLSIIDLSESANQPMSSADGKLWIVFNGEIYNHADLRAQLEKEGVVFKTDHSDTEVILQAYAFWGTECLHRFRGMFAFALWDQTKERLWLVRDRVGIKPLYYTFQKGALLFASEIKALLAHPDVKAQLDERAFYDHLTFVTSPPPRTLFKDIQKLQAGHFLMVKARGETHLERYWNPFKGVSSIVTSPSADLVPRVMGTLRDAVRSRLVSDVKVGTFLSGGIDSSAITAISSEFQPRPVETFTVGFSGPERYTEFDYAASINQKFRTNPHQIFMKPDDFFHFLPQLVESQEEPIGDPVGVPIYFLSKLARETDVIVCLVGEGSDELFCGYPYWRDRLGYQAWANRLRGVPDVIRRPLSRLFMGSSALDWTTQRRMDLLRRVTAGENVFWGGSEAFPETLKRSFLTKNFRNRLGDPSSYDSLKILHDDFLNDAPEGVDDLHWMTYVDLRLRLPEILLMRIDKMAMAASVEGRVPFLDHELIKLSMSLGVDVRFRDRELKHLLKKGVRPILPHETIDRPEQGFGVPVEYWFVNVQDELINKHVLDFMKRTGFFDLKVTERYLKQMGGQEK